MSIIVARELMCDGCAIWGRLEDPMIIEWRILVKQGWTRRGGKHWCPDCTAKRKKK